MSEAPDPNIYDDEPERRTLPGYECSRVRVGARAGGERIGTSLWTLPPGNGAYPYHFHHVEEEQIVVLEGRPLLRDPAGWRRLERGAVVAFLPGEAGGHELFNDGDAPVTFLAISTAGQADTVVYPDVNLVAVFGPEPGGDTYRFARDTEAELSADTVPLPDPPTNIP